MSAVLKIAILDVNTATTKKIIKKKKYPQVINILKEFVKATIIIKYILDLGVNLIISKLLVFALTIKKQLTKTISKDKVIQFYINNLDLAGVLEALTAYFWYFMGTPKAKVYLNNGFKIIILLNISTEINIIIKKLMKDVN